MCIKCTNCNVFGEMRGVDFLKFLQYFMIGGKILSLICFTYVNLMMTRKLRNVQRNLLCLNVMYVRQSLLFKVYKINILIY